MPPLVTVSAAGQAPTFEQAAFTLTTHVSFANGRVASSRSARASLNFRVICVIILEGDQDTYAILPNHALSGIKPSTF
mgnify:CR=1 FL=1